MILRAARLGAAAVALLLAARQGRTWWAEQAYEAGIWAADPQTGLPAIARADVDVPGRLAWYEEAAARDPGHPLYALRAGQIRLQFATRRPPPADSATQLAAARAYLEIAASGNPLDSETHNALAHASAAARDLDGTLRHARIAVLTGPRRFSSLESATRLFVSAWRATSDPDVLVDLVGAARLGLEFADGRDPALPPLGRIPVAPTVARFLDASSGPTTDDLLLALRGLPELLETAARLVEAKRPDAARTLRAAMRAETGP